MKQVVALLVVLALGLGAIGAAVAFVTGDDDSRGPDAPLPTATVEPEPGSDAAPSPALRDYYTQGVSWEPCRGEFYCGSVTVPLDYADPQGATIEIALLKAPALDPAARVGALVVNPGGPGAPGTDYAASAKLVFGDPLLRRFDIVGFDPRGTGSSAPVDCLSDEELDAFLAADPSPDTPDEEVAILADVDRLGAGCVERSGALASHVTTIEAARDMDVIRAALGEARLEYFGASYGTKLGATYADLFPDRVGRFVLDGAVDLSLSSRELTLEQAGGFETALRAYVQNCLDTSDSCFLGDDVEEGLATISDLVDAVDAEPLPTDGDRMLEPGNAFYGIIAPLYNADYWFILSAALKQAMAGNGTALLELADLYASRGPNGYTDNSAEAIYAINCLDDPYAIEPEQVPQQIPAFEEASPTFGEVFAWGLVACRGQVARASVEPRDVRAAGAPPIVVIGTTRDPATPYAWAEALAEQLESGVLVSRDGDGHTGYNAGNRCVDDAVEQFLVSEVVPDDGLAC